MQASDNTPPDSANTSSDDVHTLTPFVHKGTTPCIPQKTPSEPSHSPKSSLDDFLVVPQIDTSHSDSETIPHPVNTGKRPLRSRRTLFMLDSEEQSLKKYPTAADNSQSDSDTIKELQQQELSAIEIQLRPKLFGQTSNEKIAPTRQHFEYIYRNIHNPEIYDYVEKLEKWVKFNLKHQLYPDLSQPILDLYENDSTETEFSLTNLLVLNKDLIDKKLKEVKKLQKQQAESLKPGHGKTKTLPTHTDTQQSPISSPGDDRNDPQSSGSSSDSFVIINPNLDSTGDRSLPVPDTNKPTTSPDAPEHTSTVGSEQLEQNFFRTSSVVDPFLDSDSESETDFIMAEKKIPAFFPPDRFDGQNKTLTKQHWQIFKDFCDQQKLNFEDIPATDDTAAKPAETEKILGYFKITLLGIARDWFDRNTFENGRDLQSKFLNDFSPYGKTSHQWLQQWNTLQFNPDTDNLDEFLVKFDDLANLVGAPAEFKLKAFRVLMPRDIVIATRNLTTYEECAQTARDLMTIIQNPLTNKMSALSLMQSRSPSPTPRTRSPSPAPPPRRFSENRQPRSRSRDRGNRRAIFNNSNPRSILKKPFNNARPPQRNVSIGRSFYRPRSRPPRRPPPRCFNCGILGHVERNCFTKTRFPRSQNNFPRQFTPNMPSKRNRSQGRPRQTVHFGDQNPPPRGRGYRGRSSGYRPPQRIYNPQDRQPPEAQDFYNPNSDYNGDYVDEDYHQPQYHQSQYHQSQQPNADSIHLTDTFHDTLNQ